MTKKFLTGNSLQEADAALYGTPQLPIPDNVVATPLSIFDIWPDAVQPRRAIPSLIRGDWDGNPAEVIDVLNHWQDTADTQLGKVIIAQDILQGRGEGITETGIALIDDFVALLELGNLIFASGLLNPITVIARGDHYVIETGERRWLAHHLLAHFVDEKYNQIAARVVAKADVWAQAAENFGRSGLNDISKARQLALLLMDMYPEESFDSYETLILPGECDRRYYAQVANLRIKKGFGQRVKSAMDLHGDSRVSQFRALLRLEDKIWLQGDAENWTEGKLREHVPDSKPKPAKPAVVTEPETPDTFTGVKVSSDQKGSTVADPTASFDRDYWTDRRVNLHDMRGGYESGRVSKVVGDSLLVVMDKGGQRLVAMSETMAFSTAIVPDTSLDTDDATEDEPALALHHAADLEVWGKLWDLAVFMKDDKAQAALQDMYHMTALEAHQLEFEVHELGPQSVLHQRFGKHYDTIDNLLTRFLSRFEDALEHIEREARRYGNEGKS